MRVFVTGGTGLIGTRLIKRLRARGEEVVLLTRRAAAVREKFPDCTIVEGDPMSSGAWCDAQADCDAVINLAGENIFGKRWSDDFKKVLMDSRVKTTDNVVQALAKNPRRADGSPKILINASAIGYYGAHGDEEVNEDTGPGNDILAQICVKWEESAQKAVTLGVRTTLMRIGIVLHREGGALAPLLTPFKLGMGGPVSSGKQWMAWIHYEDVIGLIQFALYTSTVGGPINATAPNPVTNKAFGTALGKALHRPAFMPLPGFAVKLRFGGVAEVILNGQRVLPKKALALGYSFKFSTIDAALSDILKK
jgi:uncharacterized protein (TIGR01777 family)